MTKFITVSSPMLFWAFYEASGGADFAPRERVAAEEPIVIEAIPEVRRAAIAPIITTPLVEQGDVRFQHTLVIRSAAPATAEVMQAVVQETEAPLDLRIVAGNRVNLRQGPSTTELVLQTVSKGVSAEVIAMNDDGWAQIRLTETGETGWMAARLLSEG